MGARFRIVRYFIDRHPTKVTDSDLELVCELLVQGKSALGSVLPGAGFSVFWVHDQYPSLRECLLSRGVNVKIITEDKVPMIPLDSHYTSEGNRLMAKKILAELREPSPRYAGESVELQQGKAYGEKIGPVLRFLRIPYSEQQPKIEQARFPVACPQQSGDGITDEKLRQSENCLFLNVWAPSSAKKAPVIVWFHGGGLIAGSGLNKVYDGELIARAGAVFVSFNYRLRSLGFPKGKDPFLAPGIADQRALLDWVRKNISLFGGDPENLTLMGHSMGGASIRFLLDNGLAGSGVKSAALLSSGTLPGTTPKLAHWNGVRVLQTVVAGEDGPNGNLSRMLRAYLCDARVQAGAFFLLHSREKKHGSELLPLFLEESGMGERLRNSVVRLANGEAPSISLKLWSALPWPQETEPVLHLHENFARIGALKWPDCR